MTGAPSPPWTTTAAQRRDALQAMRGAARAGLDRMLTSYGTRATKRSTPLRRRHGWWVRPLAFAHLYLLVGMKRATVFAVLRWSRCSRAAPAGCDHRACKDYACLRCIRISWAYAISELLHRCCVLPLFWLAFHKSITTLAFTACRSNLPPYLWPAASYLITRLKPRTLRAAVLHRNRPTVVRGVALFDGISRTDSDTEYRLPAARLLHTF